MTICWPGPDSPRWHESLHPFCQDHPSKRQAAAWAPSGRPTAAPFPQAMAHMAPPSMAAIAPTAMATEGLAITASVPMAFPPAGLCSRLRKAVEGPSSPSRALCTPSPRSAWWWMRPSQLSTTASELCWMWPTTSPAWKFTSPRCFQLSL